MKEKKEKPKKRHGRDSDTLVLKITDQGVRDNLATFYQVSAIPSTQRSPQQNAQLEKADMYLKANTRKMIQDAITMMESEFIWKDLTEHDEDAEYHRGTAGGGYDWFAHTKDIIANTKPPKYPEDVNSTSLKIAVKKCYAAKATVFSHLERLLPTLRRWQAIEKSGEQMMLSAACCGSSQWQGNGVIATYWNVRVPAYDKIRRLEAAVDLLQIRRDSLKDAYDALSRTASIDSELSAGNGDEGFIITEEGRRPAKKSKKNKVKKPATGGSLLSQIVR